jgi:hypothetical protein
MELLQEIAELRRVGSRMAIALQRLAKHCAIQDDDRQAMQELHAQYDAIPRRATRLGRKRRAV